MRKILEPKYIDTKYGTCTKSGEFISTEPSGRKKTKYLFKCSVCNSDEELYPEPFEISREKWLKGDLNCGCFTRKLSKSQWSVVVSRKCKKLKYSFDGFSGDWLGVNTKLNLKCHCGNEWSSTSIRKFVDYNTGCPSCGLDKISTKLGRTSSALTSLANASGKYVNGIILNRSNTIKDHKGKRLCTYFCPVCSIDEYVKNGLCSGLFKISPTELGKRSCRCAKNYLWTERQRYYKINSTLNSEGGVFLRWSSSNGYSTCDSKFLWRCSNGHECETTVDSFLNASVRCSVCAISGYDKSKRGTFYLTRWWYDDETFLKLGITNKSAKERATVQKRTSLCSGFTVLIEVRFKDGTIPVAMESRCKKLLEGGYCIKDIFPDGYTETIKDTEENIKIIKDVIGGVSCG